MELGAMTGVRGGEPGRENDIPAPGDELKSKMLCRMVPDMTLPIPLSGYVPALNSTSYAFRPRPPILQQYRSVPEKLTAYREAYILKLALLEGPALVCIILHFLGGNPLLFYTSIFMIFIFAYERPIEGRIKQQLNLHPEDLIEK